MDRLIHTGFSGVGSSYNIYSGGVMSGNTNTLKMTLGGTAVVCCIHDREKRQVTTIDMLARLGRELTPPMIYDPLVHKTFLCSCCQNLFVSESDEPRYCSVCQRVPTHKQMAPLPNPSEEI